MATNDPLQGGAINLQGATPPLQGSDPQLQQPVTPQQPVNPQNQQPTAPSVTVPTQYTTPAPAPAPVPQPAQAAQPAQATPLNSIFDPYIGSRPSPSNSSVLEYFNKQTGQGFSTPQELFNFASGLGAGQVSSFDQLHAQVNPQQQTQTTSGSSTDPNQNLAQTAGNAGLSIDDLIKLATASSSLSPDEIASIRKAYGLDDVANTAFGTPSQSTVDLYNQAYAQAGLGDLKSQVQDLSTQIAKAQQDYLDASSNVNENPFLDEASRVGRIDRLNTEAQQRIGNLQQEQQNLNDLYTQGVTETNAFVTRYTNDFNTTKEQAAAKLDYLTKLADQTAQATVAQKQQQVYRYATDYLQAKQQAAEPFGSAQYGYFKYNPTTKTYDQVSGPASQFQANPATGDLFNSANGQPANASTGGLTAAFGAPAPQTGPSANLPQRNNNPGDLTNPNTGQLMVYSTPQQGWTALVNDIQAKTSGNNAHGLGANSTLQDFANVYDPKSPTNGNDPVAYAANLARQLGVTPTTKLGDLSGRTQDFAVAIANNEGYFAGSTAPGTTGASLVQQSAQQLVDGTAAPSQFSKRGAIYQTILNTANQLSMQQKGVPFDATQAETNFSNKEAARPIINLEQSVEAHLDTVLKDSEALNRSNSPAANKLNFAFQNETGPGPELTKYLQAVQDAKGEISKLLAGNGAPTDETRNEADAMLNEYLGHGDLTAQIDQIRQLAKQKVAAYTNNNNGAQQQSLPVSSSPVNISDINFAF